MAYEEEIEMTSMQVFDLYHFKDGRKIDIKHGINSQELYDYLQPEPTHAEMLMFLTTGECYHFERGNIVSAEYFTIIPVGYIDRD